MLEVLRIDDGFCEIVASLSFCVCQCRIRNGGRQTGVLQNEISWQAGMCGVAGRGQYLAPQKWLLGLCREFVAIQHLSFFFNSASKLFVDQLAGNRHGAGTRRKEAASQGVHLVPMPAVVMWSLLLSLSSSKRFQRWSWLGYAHLYRDENLGHLNSNGLGWKGSQSRILSCNNTDLHPVTAICQQYVELFLLSF